MPSMIEEIQELCEAGFSGIWVNTHEPFEVIRECTKLVRGKNAAGVPCKFAQWNVEQGIAFGTEKKVTFQKANPLEALNAWRKLVPEDIDEKERQSFSILAVLNLHKQLNGAPVLQSLQNSVAYAKANGVSIVVLAPHGDIPIEVKHQFRVVEPGMPKPDALDSVITDLVGDEEGVIEGERSLIVEAASGLTKGEAESAFALSMTRNGVLRSDTVWESKSKMLAESGSLELFQGDASFEQLGGLDSMKQFVSRSLEARDGKHKPKGIMLVGVPGSGKSQFCKAAGSESGLPVIMFDVASCFGSLVGQTEANIRRALQTAEAMAPAILFIDEIEKALAGGTGRTQGDSGVSSRLLGTLLTWLSDNTSMVYVVATCNDITAIPPEFARAERFDGLFFVDLPDRSTKDKIWTLYEGIYERGGERPDDDKWTGAEIQSCCRLSAMLDLTLVEASQYVTPVSKTYGEKMDHLREWAQDRCTDANAGGPYRIDGPDVAVTTTTGGTRKVARKVKN